MELCWRPSHATECDDRVGKGVVAPQLPEPSGVTSFPDHLELCRLPLNICVGWYFHTSILCIVGTQKLVLSVGTRTAKNSRKILCLETSSSIWTSSPASYCDSHHRWLVCSFFWEHTSQMGQLGQGDSRTYQLWLYSSVSLDTHKTSSLSPHVGREICVQAGHCHPFFTSGHLYLNLSSAK